MDLDRPVRVPHLALDEDFEIDDPDFNHGGPCAFLASREDDFICPADTRPASIKVDLRR